MGVLVNIDGVHLQPAEARVSVFDRGFLYGDSVYETLRTYGGHCFRLAAHLARLERSAAGLGISLPLTAAQAAAEIGETIRAAANDESTVRVTVTRGEAAIGLDPRAATHATRVVIVRPFVPLDPELRARGVDVVVARTLRNAPSALDPGIKSGNFLNNIQAVREANESGAFEAIMFAQGGRIAEATQSNVFLVLEGELVTPHPRAGLLRGITRDLVLELAQSDGIPVAERDLVLADLERADELFLTSSLKEVLPVRRVDGRPVGSGCPGPITARLVELYRQEVERFIDCPDRLS